MVWPRGVAVPHAPTLYVSHHADKLSSFRNCLWPTVSSVAVSFLWQAVLLSTPPGGLESSCWVDWMCSICFLWIWLCIISLFKVLAVHALVSTCFEVLHPFASCPSRCIKARSLPSKSSCPTRSVMMQMLLWLSLDTKYLWISLKFGQKFNLVKFR